MREVVNQVSPLLVILIENNQVVREAVPRHGLFSEHHIKRVRNITFLYTKEQQLGNQAVIENDRFHSLIVILQLGCQS